MIGESSIRPFNRTHVVFIPKVNGPHKVANFRPITLCSVVYKVITKALANHLKPTLPLVISNEQNAFVLGRLISDNVIVAFKAMHSLPMKIGDKVGFSVLKLDISKAYD